MHGVVVKMHHPALLNCKQVLVQATTTLSTLQISGRSMMYWSFSIVKDAALQLLTASQRPLHMQPRCDTQRNDQQNCSTMILVVNEWHLLTNMQNMAWYPGKSKSAQGHQGNTLSGLWSSQMRQSLDIPNGSQVPGAEPHRITLATTCYIPKPNLMGNAACTMVSK